MSQQFERFVGVITALSKEVSRIKTAEMRRFGLRGTDVMCLYYLEKDPAGTPASELARQIGVDRAAVSRTLASLEAKGIVYTLETDGGARYRSPIRLTEKGQVIMHEVNGIIGDVVANATEGLSAVDREVMYDILGSILMRLEAIDR